MNFNSGDDEPLAATSAQLRHLADERAPILQQLSEGVIIAGLDGRLLFVNEAAERIHGVKRLDVAPDDYSERYSLFTMGGDPYPSHDLPLARAVLSGETIEDARWRIRRPDGSEVVALGSARPLTQDGKQIGAILTIHDDSDRFETERRLRESEERFHFALNAASAIGTWDWDIRKDLIYADERFAELYSVDPKRAATGAPLAEFANGIHPDDRDRVNAAIEQALTSGDDYEAEYRLLQSDGTDRWVIARGRAYYDDAGAPIRFPGATFDITNRKATERALRESEERLRLVLDAAPGGFYSVDRAGSTTLVSRGFLELMGFASEAEAIGRKLHGVIHHSHSDGTPYRVEQCPIYLCAATGAPAHVSDELFFRLDGSQVPVEYWVAPIMRGDEHVGATCTILDVTDRKAAEQALRERSEEFYTLADNIPALAWMAYAEGDIFWYNRRWYEYTGTTSASQVGWGWDSVHDPEVLPLVVDRWQRSIATGEPFEMTFPLRSATGEFRPFLTRVIPIRDDLGDIVRWFGTNVDISEVVETQRALKTLNETLETRVEEEIARRTEVEEALRQSQKMETIGQLTGGVAHDFNNLLQIITGNLDIIRRNIPGDLPRLSRSVENAMRGAERAAILTQRLLAFSRRQPLAPKIIDPNKLVSGMSEMLHRTLGETIAIEAVHASGLWRVEADPNQLENALLNLAVNSRDAMPKGGKLTIETANTHLDRDYAERHGGVLAGQYVMICVTDTGSGMTSVIAERVFEPFFTTKDVGKGTGLGLSMVYGFVKQSGGHLNIYSEPGEGTTVKIYLPRHLGVEAAATDSMSSDLSPEGVEGETILVCEDDEDVRAYSVESLRELGYRVIEAADGEEALRLLDSEDGRVDLLFTDVVLPGGMTGATVAERARQARPGLKVLFTTGYARNAIVHQGRLDSGVELLSKPFAYAELAARIRDLLDAA